MPKQLEIYPEKCIGCRSCELACSFENDSVLNPAASRIHMISFSEGTYRLPANMPLTCRQCADAPCIRSCPVDAVSRTGCGMQVVRVDDEACIGCGECVLACPFGAMFFNREKKRPFKCELCGGKPACAAICPGEAIVFVNRTPFYSKGQALENRGVALLLRVNAKDVRAQP